MVSRDYQFMIFVQMHVAYIYIGVLSWRQEDMLDLDLEKKKKKTTAQ